MLRLSMTSLQRFNKINYIVLRNFAKKFTKEHEWVEVEKDVATIGITDFAQSELGEIVHVDLPAIGNHYKIQETLVRKTPYIQIQIKNKSINSFNF